MARIVKLDVPFRQISKAARQAALLERFAFQRRNAEDVFWLKENAELLNVLQAGASQVDPAALSVHETFYDELDRRLGFFPQYYRFLISMCLDLEDMGLPGAKGADLVAWVAKQGLVAAELSDLQRAEARRLCLRRGVDPLPDDDGLNERLRDFTDRATTFAMPNKKAAYELTHIVFYLSEYGRRDPGLTAGGLESLKFAGTLAFLELNCDLLAEICIAMRFAGQTPPATWENWLASQARAFRIAADAQAPVMDDYHQYLMVNWLMCTAELGGFAQQVPQGEIRFAAPAVGAGPLRELSEIMFRLDSARSDDWQAMRERVANDMSGPAQSVLVAAEAAIEGFDSFFAGFARVGLQEDRA